MQNFSWRFAASLLAFAVGTAAASVWFFQTKTEKYDPPVAPLVNNINNVPLASQKTLEMVFVLDTTGSMGGLLDGAKQKIWSIVNDVMQQRERPRVKIGLVAYRDNGDSYVTQVTPLSDDLDKIYSVLMEFEAAGGGDTPENVRRALAEGIEKTGWTQQNKDVAQILFLVGDAPPQNYAQEPDVLATTAKAVRRNMIVNTIQCGAAADTRQIWQQIAERGAGKYFAIAQDGGVRTISTPFDQKLSELANKLGGTFLAYGGGAGADGDEFRARKQAVQSGIESSMASNSSMTAQADRALNKAINKDAYADDLIQSIENETVKLEAVKEDDLPADLKPLAPAERKAEIEKRLAERRKIRAEILDLSKQRDAFVAAEKKKNGAADGFDAAVSRALSEQLTRKGIK